jgi:hypothetical protein
MSMLSVILYAVRRMNLNRAACRIVLVLCVCFAWALISLAPIWKYLSPGKAAAATLFSLLFIALAMCWLGRINRRRQQISIGWLVLLFLVLTAAFAVMYPRSLKAPLSRRSDREDALRIELSALHNHQYPYDARTFLGNPPTPLPGALLLAEPFYELGHIAWQNLLWLALFFVFTLRFFRYRATALFFLAVFLLFAPANLADLTAGGDYLTNYFYFAIAVALFVRALGRSFYGYTLAALFLGVTLSSRIVYGVVLIPLLAYTLQRVSRFRAAILFGIVILAGCAVTLPVFAPHPFSQLLQQLDQNSRKLRYIPAVLHPQLTLPLLAVLISCVAFFRRMDIPRLFLVFSIASFVMFAPFAVTFALSSVQHRNAFSYLSVCALPFSLWVLSEYEGISRKYSAERLGSYGNIEGL